ncbi:Flagellar protein FlaG [hydrothermal vent metagenome]|uniref:Flagellar protein FlaG n=1 Tax=hydrothermal vent metagenome TaxID=652676 RepID=A0A3B0YNP6_9ZZZZ
MSTDIVTKQISKDALTSTTARPANAANTQNRQSIAAEEGKTLPSNSPAEKLSSEELQQVVTQLNKQMQQIQRDLLFSVDDSSGRTVVQVVNTETEEVVRQIPSEEVLRISSSLQEQLDGGTGLIFETSA